MYLCLTPCDMRKSFDSLHALVRDQLGLGVARSGRKTDHIGAAANGLEFDYDNPVPDDREADNAELIAKSQALKVYVELGATWESACEALELPVMEFEKPEPPPAPMLPPGPAEDVPEDDPKARGALAVLNRVKAKAEAASDPVDDVDLDQVQEAWEEAVAALLVAWGPILGAQIAALVEQIAEAINLGDLAQLAALTAPSGEAAQILSAAMIRHAATAAAHVVDEAAAQDVDISVFANDVETVQTAEIAMMYQLLDEL